MEITTTRTARRARVRLAGTVIALGLPDTPRSASPGSEPGSPSQLGATEIARRVRHRSTRAAQRVANADSSVEGWVPLRPAADAATQLPEGASAS